MSYMKGEEIQEMHSRKKIHVVVIVIFEDILMYIISVYCCTPIEGVFPSVRDVIIIYGH